MPPNGARGDKGNQGLPGTEGIKGDPGDGPPDKIGRFDFLSYAVHMIVNECFKKTI